MTTTFHIAPQYRDLLQQNGLDSFEALFAYEHGTHVDGHRDRSVTRLELTDPSGRKAVFYLKREWNPKAAMLVRRMLEEGMRFPPSRSMKEWRSLHALRRREVGTAEPVAVGEYRRGGFFRRACLLVREVPNGISLAQILSLSGEAAIGNAARRTLAVQTAAMIRRMHDRGMAFTDLYTKHVYVDPSQPGGSFRPALIDAQRARRFWHMMPTARWHDLAALCVTSMSPGCRRTDRLKFLLAYSRQSQLSPAVKLMARRIMARAEKLGGRGLDPRQSASRWQAPPGMVPINELNIKYIDNHQLLVAERYLPELRRLGLDKVEKVMRFEGGKSFREKAGRSTVRIEIEGADGQPSALYIKRHREVDGRAWLDGLLHWRKPRTRADVEYRNIIRLCEHGIASATPVALGQLQSWGRRQDSFLATEEIPDAEPADDYLRAHFAILTGDSAGSGDGTAIGDRADQGAAEQTTAPGTHGQAVADATGDNRHDSRMRHQRRRQHLRAKRRLLAEIARTARKFHQAGFYHRDFYLCHFFVREIVPEPDVIGSPQGADEKAAPDTPQRLARGTLPQWNIHLIDLQRVGYPGPGRVRRRWIIKDLAALNYSAPAGIITRTDKMRFMHIYTGRRRLDDQGRALVRDVLAKTARIARHDANMRARGET